MNLSFKTHSRNYYHETSYLTLVAYLNGNPVGHIDFNVFENNLSIEMVEVKKDFKRRGIGKAMMDELYKEYPDLDVNIGYTTDEGEAFFEKNPVRQLDREQGFSNKDFVLSHLEGGKNSEEVHYQSLDFALYTVGISLNEYDMSWEPHIKKFWKDVEKVKDWSKPAKYLRDRRGLKRNASTTTQFMSEFKSNTIPSHDSVDRVYDDSVAIDLIPSKDSILIASIVSLDGPGSGAGTDAMKWLVSLANKHNVTLELYPSRIGAEGPRKGELTSWYSRLGFKPDVGNKMVYKPTNGIPEHLLQSGNDRYENGKIIRGVVSKLSKSEIEIPKEVAQKFEDLADEQRGAPEHAMVQAQHVIGGGLLSVIIEHAGDLIHRMSEMTSYGYTGREYVAEKLEKLKRWLGSPYGVKKEIDENAEANARYDKIDINTYWKRVNDALKVYVQEHRKLTPYNKAQQLANDIAIKCGWQMYAAAFSSVLELEKLVNSPDWDKHAREYTLDESGNLKRYGTTKKLAKRDLYYHGTSSTLLRKILKEGLNPSPKERQFDREQYEDRGGTRSISPYGGVYMTSNPFSSYSFSNTAKRNFGGNNLLLALTYESETPTTLLDEDPVGFWMLDAIGTRFFDTLRHIENAAEKYHMSTWSLEYAFKDIEKGDITDKSHELVDSLVSMINNSDTKLANVAEHVLNREYSKRFIDDETLKHIKPKIVSLMVAVYKANIKHLLDEELKHKMPQLRGSLQELKDATNVLSKYINTQGHDKLDHRIRSTEPIGFSGKNRIITILEFVEYKVGIEDAFLIKDVFIRYGTDWTMFKNLFEERLGYPFRVFDKTGKVIYKYYGRANSDALDKIWSQSLDAFKTSSNLMSLNIGNEVVSMAKYEIINHPINQVYYPDFIGHIVDVPPANAIVQEVTQNQAVIASIINKAKKIAHDSPTTKKRIQAPHNPNLWLEFYYRLHEPVMIYNQATGDYFSYEERDDMGGLSPDDKTFINENLRDIDNWYDMTDLELSDSEDDGQPTMHDEYQDLPWGGDDTPFGVDLDGDMYGDEF
jgi:GNAT superfamily N-acetyltransferase